MDPTFHKELVNIFNIELSSRFLVILNCRNFLCSRFLLFLSAVIKSCVFKSCKFFEDLLGIVHYFRTVYSKYTHYHRVVTTDCKGKVVPVIN
jgi:hypothetical protein